jgi:tryptophan synthase alpha chain
MNRINQLFEKKNNNILSIYFTAGFPQLNDTATILKSIEASGADMVEIGMPFSDPLADGPVIQDSSTKALKNGMSLKTLFEQLKDIRKQVNIPLLLMGYLNPVFKFSFEEFCKKCNEVGIDGLIIPDLPIDEYLETYRIIMEKYNLHNIFLITPQTADDRIRKIDSISKGFIYVVSSFSTTGSGKGLEQSQQYFERISKMNLKNPTIVGFGIKDKATFDNACQYANGAIIGTSFVKMLEQEGKLEKNISDFIKEVKYSNTVT